MAGNFSFGDYFKRRAIELAWTLLTNPVDEGGYGLDPERLWATVYLDDDEASRAVAGGGRAAAERIQRRGMADNYWSMGIPGPCGPSSEIYYDRGPEFGVEGGPDRQRGPLHRDLESRVHAERARRGHHPRRTSRSSARCRARTSTPAWVSSGWRSCCRVCTTSTRPTCCARSSTLWPRVSPRGYDVGNHEDDVRYRIIADHSRTAAILIGDGVSPGNDGRGYVLRRLLRRVIRSAKLLGIDDPIVGDLMATVRDAMGAVVPRTGHRLRPDPPHRGRRGDRVQPHAGLGFAAVRRGGRARRRRRAPPCCPGTDAFTLHDTYGFPLELTLEMAAESGLSVDEEGFRGLMAEQRQRAKADAAARKQAHADLSEYRDLVDAGPTEFTGFDELTSEAKILGIFVDGKRVPVVSHDGQAPDRVELMLDRTPVLRRVGRPDRRRGQHHGCRRIGLREGRRHRRAEDRQNTVGAPRQRRVRRVRRGRHRRRRRRPALAARRHPGPFRHPHGARRAATSAGPQRRSGRLAEPARLPAVRLQLAGRADRRPADPDRGSHQRGGRGRLRGAQLHHRTGQGQGDGRDGAVRRGLSRRGPGGRDRRAVLAGTVRRYARRAVRRRSARSRSSASRRSAPACAASRPTSAWTRSATWPRNAR